MWEDDSVGIGEWKVEGGNNLNALYTCMKLTKFKI